MLIADLHVASYFSLDYRIKGQGACIVLCATAAYSSTLSLSHRLTPIALPVKPSSVLSQSE